MKLSLMNRDGIRSKGHQEEGQTALTNFDSHLALLGGVFHFILLEDTRTQVTETLLFLTEDTDLSTHMWQNLLE